MAIHPVAIDPILSMLVAILVAFAGWRIARRAGHILVEGAPDGLTPDTIANDLLANISELADVSHIHTWSLTEKQPMVTLEAMPKPDASPQKLRITIKERLADSFGVTHTTVEILDSNEKPSSSKSDAHSAS